MVILYGYWELTLTRGFLAMNNLVIPGYDIFREDHPSSVKHGEVRILKNKLWSFSQWVTWNSRKVHYFTWTLRAIALVIMFAARTRFPFKQSIVNVLRKRYGKILVKNVRKFEKYVFKYVMRYAIWYHLYNLKTWKTPMDKCYF